MGLGIRTLLFYEWGIGKRIKSAEPSFFFPEKTEKISLYVSFKPFGGLAPAESVFLSFLASYIGCESVFEMGTCTGLTAMNVIGNIPGQIATLDLPAEKKKTSLQTEKSEQSYMTVKKEDLFWNGKPGSERIKALKGDSATFDYSPYEKKVDLVFVDASHSYAYVLNDSQKALSLLKERGAILWHDYSPCWPGVVKALNELSQKYSLWHIKGTSLVLYLSTSLQKELNVKGCS